ncbi:Elongation factor P [Micractinium conductrix]|uniref:Elongation factor P n=1 Tax=Micractinium conductrix TaxID=554055 RepID=A0A2P6V2S0_9CHLO|nr:Elongation factor P [Micractinium conductrix]|eukprot:PSC68390.1 Elongation factor P [Micractinium conductrix]
MRGLQQLLTLRSLLCGAGALSLSLSESAAFPQALPSLAQALQQLGGVQARGVKKQANELRIGNVIEHNGKLLQVVSMQNRAMGRQLGNVNFELRDIITKSKHPAKFRPSDMVEYVRLEGRPYQCLYTEGTQVHCMDPETYEQLAVEREVFGGGADFLAEGLEVILNFHAGNDAPVTGEVPNHVTLGVVEAAPTMKGETAAPSYKRAVCAGGIEVQVPPFVQTGDRVVVETSERAFVRRA